MRDKLKDKNYFESYIYELDEMIALNNLNLEKGRIPDVRVIWVKMNTFNYQLNKVIALYSIGASFEQITQEFLQVINIFFMEAWVEKSTKVHLGANKYLDQYTVESHGKMLRMLSIGYLLNIEENIFKILVNKIDVDNISDNLFEFIIKARIPYRLQKREEDYDNDKSIILRVYEKLRKAIKAKHKSDSITLIEEYLKKDFNHKYSGFYNSHKSRANVYYGYWSFESVAIMSILGLDDRDLRDNKYYPKDIFDYHNPIS